MLQPNASNPPDAYPPIVSDPGAGPGEGEQDGVGPETASNNGTKIASNNGTTLSSEEAPTSPTSLCLDVLGGSAEDGAVITLSECVEDGNSQEWELVEVEGGAGEGSIVSGTTGQCVTAGWPFLTGAAFEMNKESKYRYNKAYAVVLLNEAEEPAEFDLSFPAEGFKVRAVIGPRAIQTILA